MALSRVANSMNCLLDGVMTAAHADPENNKD